MKKIVSGAVLQDKMREAINLLCDTVKCTLGPKGSNVIIDNTNFSPFITNDGVTIAQSIESDDEVINTILEIAKESSVKTNQEVGDGTTTTLVMLQSLLNLSLDLISNGKNPMVLKKELNEWLERILDMLVQEKLSCNEKITYNVAKVSSNDEKIAMVVSDVLKNIPYKEAVSIKEVNVPKVSVNYYNGYCFSSELASLLFLKDEASLSYKDSFILIVDDVLEDFDSIGNIINDFFDSDKCLVIVANDFSLDVVNNIISYVLNDELNCLLVKISEYGFRKRIVLKDLEVISGATILNNEKDISVKSLGVLKSVFATKDFVRVDFSNSDNVTKYVLSVSEELKDLDDEYSREFYLKRLSMFDTGTALIDIGAYTKTELRERRMRLDDALCAVYSLGEGVVLGGGITLLKIANQINSDDDIAKIWKKTLETPFKQLMCNSGEDYKVIKNKLEKENFDLIYNVSSGSFENKSETKVVDSYSVVVNSIVNACSIASMLVTTNSLIVNEQVNNLNKVSDYGEI